jgi:hydrogenase maturation protease
MNESADDARGFTSGIIKIIGIGQSLRGDDAAGLEAVRLWQKKYCSNQERPYIQVELIELPGIELLNSLEGASLVILVDAVVSQAKPGTVHLLSPDQLEAFQSGAGSAHGWGVAETISLGQQLIPSRMPKKLLVIGIETANLSVGASLSSEVTMALADAAQLIEQLVKTAHMADQEPSSSPRISPK